MSIIAINDLQPASVKLADLTFDLEHNSRTSAIDEQAMTELVKSIEANGLITPIAVRKGVNTGHFLVIDGHRRLEALNRLYGEKADEVYVPVLVRAADDKDARALSLAANIVRLPLHPADQFEAFKAMLDEGLERQEIAARFGLTVKEVDQRLVLGGVIKPFFEAYRRNEINLDTMKKLSSVSAEKQQAIFTALKTEDAHVNAWPWKIRAMIEDEAIYSTDPVAQFVTVDAYEEAGGRIETDLFSDKVRLIDKQLLFRLAEQRLPQIIETLTEEGWSWVAREDEAKGWNSWARHYADALYTEEQRKKLDDLHAEISNLEDKDDFTDEDQVELDRLEAERDALEDSVPEGFSDEQKRTSGVIIRNDFQLVLGVRRPAGKEAKAGEGAAAPKSEDKGWSQKLIDEVDSYGTVAAQLAIMREVETADCMLLASMYQDTVSGVYADIMAINTAGRFADVEINAGSEIQKGLKAFALKGGNFWSLVEQIRELGRDRRDLLRAVLTARAMKKLHGKDIEQAFKQFETVDVLATWKPDKAFFERLNTKQLSEIYKELTGFALKEGTKKQDAVAMVATKAAAVNWLPKWLRTTATVIEAPKPKKKKAEKGDITTTVVGEDGKTASVRRKKAA